MIFGTVISLFTGAMGLDLGLDREGFQVRIALDEDPWAIETVKVNRSKLQYPDVEVICDAVGNVSTGTMLEKARLNVGEATVCSGAPPCEPYSTAGKRNGQQDHRADTIIQFIRVIEEARPQYFVLEEVKGFLSAAKKHVSFYDRVGMGPDELEPEEKLGSLFKELMAAFISTGYALSYDPDDPKASVLDAADFGAPQHRQRFILIGAREGPTPVLPSPTHGPHGTQEWVTLHAALDDLDDSCPQYPDFPSTWGRYLESVPPGGCWRDLPPHLQREALGGAYDDPDNPRTRGKKGGRTGFLRRLSWQRPSPTLVDRPNTRACCLCHPDETRPLSLKEYARLQGFPDDWEFVGPEKPQDHLKVAYRLVGQATPVRLAQAVADTIKAHLIARAELETSTQPVTATL